MRSIFQGLGKLVIVCIAVAILIIFIATKNSSTYQRMDERANLKAFCDSVDGNLGGDRCFINGVEVVQ